MAYYNTPTGNETSGFYEIFKFVGLDTTGGLFFPVILLVIWVVSFLALKDYSSSRAWTFASFFCGILSIFMAVLNIIDPKWMYILIFFTAIGLAWLKMEST